MSIDEIAYMYTLSMDRYIHFNEARFKGHLKRLDYAQLVCEHLVVTFVTNVIFGTNVNVAIRLKVVQALSIGIRTF